VGKKELLGWVSATCGRPVASFSALKDGDALVRCVEETWPLAYDEVRPRFPKRMDGSRDPKENFELVKAVFASIRLPPAALDVRGVRASAFKPCYNLLVVCFFLRNLALHGDFSVDFTHPLDATLTQFLQSPASVESLRRGGALPPGPGEKTPVRTESAPRRPRRRGAHPHAAPALETPTDGAEHAKFQPSSETKTNAASPTRGPETKPTRRGLAYREGGATRTSTSSDPVFRPPSPPRGASVVTKKSYVGGGGEALGAPRLGTPRLGTPDRSAERPPRLGSDSLGRFLRRRSAGGTRSALGVSLTDATDATGATDANDGQNRAVKTAVETPNERLPSPDPGELFRRGDRPDISSPGRPLDADADAFSSDALASARFEAEGLRRVLRGAKSERDDAAKRHEAELDALRARFAADAEATRAAERRRRHEMELRFAERRTRDQRAFLRELRAVAEETAGFGFETRSADETCGDDDETAKRKRRAAMENVRGREVAALETRVRSLEEERERLLVDLAGATAALNENEGEGDESREGDEGTKTNDVLKVQRRADVVRLRNELRLAEARHVADASSRAREIDELRLELRVTRGELADAKHARRYAASEADGASENASASPVFAALLGEHRDARRVARLEAEAKQARDVASAARKQVDALLLEARRTDADGNGKNTEMNGKNTEENISTTDDNNEDDAALAAADAGTALRAVAVLRDAALAPGCDAEAAETVAAAARAAEAAAWRRAAAAAVSRRRLLRARAEAAEARARVATLETEARDAEAAAEAREASLRRRARDAEEDLARERAAGGVRAALAEEAERLARSEAEDARREAAEARQDASAAHGVSAGALRDARDVAAKLKLRETHWVGLVACHREAASVSRAVAERVAKTNPNVSFGFGTTETLNPNPTNDADDLALGLELENHKSRRLELEVEAAKHAEAIEAIAAMLPEKIRETSETEGKMSISEGLPKSHASARELARLEARAGAAESAAEALRARLARKTEDAAALALRAKRHELRAEEAAMAAEASARERRDAADAHRVKQAETEDLVRRSRIDADAARREASAAKAALEDRDAALDVGVAVVRADPELARSMMRANARRVVDDATDDDDEAEDLHEADEEDIARTESSGRFSFGSPSSFGGFARKNVAAKEKARKNSKKTTPFGVVPLTSPEAVAAAVAEATRAIATTPGSIESRVAPFSGRSPGTTSSVGAYRDKSGFETAGFINLDDVVKPPRRRDVFAKRFRQTSPGGESVGSVGETLGETLSETLATPDARRTRDRLDVASARAVDDAVDALVDAEAADRVTPRGNEREPPPSPFRGFLDMFSPRRGARAGSGSSSAAPSVEEETEDSEATDPDSASVREGEGEHMAHTSREHMASADAAKEDAGGASPARASPTAGLTSYSPLPGEYDVSGSRSAGTSSLGLPGGSSFLRDAEAHLAIEVKRSWFGLRDDEDPNASPSSRRSETNARGGPGE